MRLSRPVRLGGLRRSFAASPVKIAVRALNERGRICTRAPLRVPIREGMQESHRARRPVHPEDRPLVVRATIESCPNEFPIGRLNEKVRAGTICRAAAEHMQVRRRAGGCDASVPRHDGRLRLDQQRRQPRGDRGDQRARAGDPRAGRVGGAVRDSSPSTSPRTARRTRGTSRTHRRSRWPSKGPKEWPWRWRRSAAMCS